MMVGETLAELEALEQRARAAVATADELERAAAARGPAFENDAWLAARFAASLDDLERNARCEIDAIIAAANATARRICGRQPALVPPVTPVPPPAVLAPAVLAPAVPAPAVPAPAVPAPAVPAPAVPAPVVEGVGGDGLSDGELELRFEQAFW